MSSSTVDDERAARIARVVAHVVVTALALWAVASFAPAARGLPHDASWMHQVFARTLAHKGALALAPGQHGVTFLSPAWDLLLALNHAAVKVDPARWAFGLNVVLHVVTMNGLLVIVSREGPEDLPRVAWRVACAGAIGAVACSAELAGFVASGTETTLFIALVTAAIGLASHGRLVAGGAAAALAASTRPEGLFVGVLVVAVSFALRSDVRRALVAALPPALVGAILYMATSLGTLHFASTMWSGRHWLWFETSAGLPNSDLQRELASAWVSRLGEAAGLSHLHPALPWIALGLAVYGGLRLAILRNSGGRMLLAWGVVEIWWLLRNVAPQGPGGAWQPFVPILFTSCAAFGLSFVWWDLLRRGAASPTARGAVAVALVAFAWIAIGHRGLVAERAAYRAMVADLDATALAMGERVAQLPESAVVASFDSGAIAYRSRRALVDIGSLADPELAVLVERGRVWEHLREKGVTHVALAESLASRLHLDDNPAVMVKPVEVVGVSPKSFTLYELAYTGRPGPRRVLPARWAARGIWDDDRIVPRRDRLLAEHLFGILAEWDVRIDLAVVREPRPIGGGIRENTKDPAPPCAIAIGPWGVDVDECELVGPTGEVRAILKSELQPYLAANDLGGAVRAIPHFVTRVRRGLDDRFVPLMPPLRSPAADAERGGTPTSPLRGIALAAVGFLLALFSAFGTVPPAEREAWRARLASRARALARLVVRASA